MTLNEAATKFLAWKRFDVKQQTATDIFNNLRLFCLCEKNPPLESVSVDMVVSHLQMMRDLGYGQHALYDRAVCLRTFLDWTKKMGLSIIDGSLVPKLRREFVFPKVLEEESYQRLLAAIPYGTEDPRHIRSFAIVTMLWDTGMRISELLSLNVSDLDLERKMAHVKTAKSKGLKPMRQVMWIEDTNDYLKEWLKKRAHLEAKQVFRNPEALFIGVCSWKVGCRLSTGGFGASLRNYSKKAGLPYVNAHSFRHHMGRDLAMKGANNTTISNILGHSSINSSLIYTMLDDRQLEEQYRRFKGT